MLYIPTLPNQWAGELLKEGREPFKNITTSGK